MLSPKVTTVLGSVYTDSFLFMQLDLLLNPPPKIVRNKLSPEIRAQRKEKSEARIIFKLLKSNKFNDFSEKAKELLEKYYGIRL